MTAPTFGLHHNGGDEWRVDVRIRGGVQGVMVDRCGAAAEHWAAFLAALGSDDLPDGVSRLKSGELVALGQDIPEGWGWRIFSTDTPRGHDGVAADTVYFVCPPEEPETERIPWHEAVSGKRQVVTTNGPDVMTRADNTPDGIYLSGEQWGQTPDDDGMVTVLVED